IGAIERALAALDGAGGGGGAGDGAIVPGMPQTLDAFRRLTDMATDLRDEIAQLEVEAALAAGTDEAARLADKLQDAREELLRIQRALAGFSTDTSGMVPRLDVGTSIARRGVPMTPAERVVTVDLAARAQAMIDALAEAGFGLED